MAQETISWICSDPDCSQYYRKLSDYSYAFIELREYPNDTFIVCFQTVDIRDYTLGELWNYCSGYYSSFEEIVKTYSFREFFHIAAECIFEQLCCDEMDSCFIFPSFEEGDEFIHRWIDTVGQEDLR